MMDAPSKPLAFLRERRGRPLQRLLAAFGDRMPKGLYARALIIIIAPMVLLQSVLTFVFLERHWQTVTRRLSTVSPSFTPTTRAATSSSTRTPPRLLPSWTGSWFI